MHLANKSPLRTPLRLNLLIYEHGLPFDPYIADRTLSQEDFGIVSISDTQTPGSSSNNPLCIGYYEKPIVFANVK